MLLPKPLAEIAAVDIKEFAHKFPEGLRVEYKSGLTDPIRRANYRAEPTTKYAS